MIVLYLSVDMNLELKHKKKVDTKEEVIKILLKNRKINSDKEKNEFFNPKDPLKITLEEVGISKEKIKNAIKRIKESKKNKEKVLIYGDYDADGICATAILWETLYRMKLDVVPYIPERFSEGYGLNSDTVARLKLKIKELGLIITVDNGIVAFDGVKKAKDLGIDVIITDHHERKKVLPKTKHVLYTTKVGGAALSWFFAREIIKSFKTNKSLDSLLELCAIGTISDQIPLIGTNRSIVKYGIDLLGKTKRKGLLSLYRDSGIKKENGRYGIGIYDVNFIIAPRLNAMGRLKEGMDSLRLLCTLNSERADDLSKTLNSVNLERQKIVEKAYLKSKASLNNERYLPILEKGGVVVLSHTSFHEGVIGLVASNLVEEYFRPAIIISEKKNISKGSARSIPGFNIIDAIRSVEDILIEAGGHPMAAGFSIETKNILRFEKAINKYSKNILTEDVLSRSQRVDLEMDFDLIDDSLYKNIKIFEPAGIGNPTPVFLTKGADVIEIRKIGRSGNHLKLKIAKGSKIFDAVYFNAPEEVLNLSLNQTPFPADFVYTIDENIWNGRKSLQLKIKTLSVAPS